MSSQNEVNGLINKALVFATAWGLFIMLTPDSFKLRVIIWLPCIYYFVGLLVFIYVGIRGGSVIKYLFNGLIASAAYFGELRSDGTNNIAAGNTHAESRTIIKSIYFIVATFVLASYIGLQTIVDDYEKVTLKNELSTLKEQVRQMKIKTDKI